MIDITKLRELAEGAKAAYETKFHPIQPDRYEREMERTHTIHAFQKAFDSQTILELCDEIELLRKFKEEIELKHKMLTDGKYGV